MRSELSRSGRRLSGLTVGLGLAVSMAVLAGAAGTARADIPPPDACTAPGQPCNNAGAQHDQAGTCVETTCTRTVPAPDGGIMSMTYPCNLCKAGGAGGSGGGGQGGAAPPPKGSDGCSTAGPATAHRAGAGLLALAVVTGVLSARRRRR